MFMQMYGEYLLNGGTPERFMDLTHDEVQLMITVSSATRAKERNDLMRALGRMLGAKEL